MIAPKRMEICTTASHPRLIGGSAGWWIVVGDEPVEAEDLKSIEIEHSSSHTEVRLGSKLHLFDTKGAPWQDTVLGRGDPIALAAFPWLSRQRDGGSEWVWWWSWPVAHHGAARFSTFVRLGSHYARFETEVDFDSECTHRPRATAAQLVVATNAGPPENPIVAELRQRPPEHELQANRSELLTLLRGQSEERLLEMNRLVQMDFVGHSMEGIADFLSAWFDVSVQLAPEISRRMVTFVADPAPAVDAFVLLAHHESLRFEVTDGTLFILDAAECEVGARHEREVLALLDRAYSRK